ncbi:MAG: hypothetical protein GXO91_03310 [FCB group bacterium]|nr:hypothetical protein [FCB group bacterium]
MSTASIWKNSLTLLLLIGAIFPKNLTILERIDPSNHELLDVEISGDLMMIPGGLGGVSIFDISDPYQPDQLSAINIAGCEFGRTYNWEIRGNYAYGAGRDCGIAVLNIANPSNPSIVSYIGSDLPSSFEDVEVRDGILVTAAHTDGVLFFDVSDPGNAQYLSQAATENAWSVAVRDHLVYVANGNAGLVIIDYNTATDPQILGIYPTSGGAKDVRLAGDMAYLAVGNSGVDLFDISDPANAQFLANYNTGGFASRVAVSGPRVAVSNWDDLKVLEWNGSAFELVGYKNTGGRVMAVGAVGDLIYSAEWRYVHLFEYGPVNGPDIDLSTREINFPQLAPGESDTAMVTVENNGSNMLNFDMVWTTNDEYEVETELPLLVPNHFIDVEIIYTADSQNSFAEYVFRTDDPDEPEVSILLTGNNNGVQPGQTAPDFTIPVAANGSGNFTLSEHLGEVIILAFFAPW